VQLSGLAVEHHQMPISTFEDVHDEWQYGLVRVVGAMLRPRWAMSFLKGPMTPHEIRGLRAEPPTTGATPSSIG
jgi:hypothetical protein